MLDKDASQADIPLVYIDNIYLYCLEMYRLEFVRKKCKKMFHLITVRYILVRWKYIKFLRFLTVINVLKDVFMQA